MKTIYLKHFLKLPLVFLLLLMGHTGWGQIIATSNFGATSGSIDENISFTTQQNQSSTQPAWNTGSNELRLYYHSGGNGGSVTLQPAEGIVITNVVLTSSTSPTVKYNVDGGEDLTASLSGTTYTISDIEAGESLKIRNANTSNTQLRLTGITVTYELTTSDPIFNISTSEITGLGYMEGNAPVSQSFSVSGLNLDPANGNITVTAPANFQVSIDDVSFNNSLNIAYTDGTLAATDVFVRLNESLAISTYNGDIEISGGGVTDVTVSVEGVVTEFVNICGEEDFTNSALTSSYANGNFVGNNGITWTYVASRDHNNDANNSGIDGKAIMLRRVSDNSAISSSTISNGIGNFSVKLYKGFTGGGNRQVELFINGISQGTSIAFDDNNEHIFEVNNINIAGDFTIEIKNITSTQVILDDITWTCYSAGPVTQVATPSITASGVENGVDTYFNTANITLATTTDGATIYYTTDGSDPTTTSTEYTSSFAVTSTTTIKAFAVADDLDDSNIAEKTITITEPATAAIPYSEAFDNTLGDWISFTNAGVNWTAGSAGASVNGYNSQSELVWLLSPKFLTAQANSLLSFDHTSQFTTGNDLEIRYSTDYVGYGDPTVANWTTLQAITSVSNGSVTDLAIPASGDIHIALVYTDVSSPYAQWTISNLSIEEPSTDPILFVSETELTGFTYGLGNGPSTSQSFVLSGENLNGSEDITLLADTGFEISLNDIDFEDELILTDYEGENTTVYVRLASGLALGAHSGIILIDGYGADEEVSVSGSVLAVPVVTEADDLTAQVGVSFSYEITASDEPFSYVISSDDLPTGLSLNEETGLISGTPTVAGEFIFGVTAENAIGTSEEAVFIINVAKGVQTVTGLGNIDAYLGDADIILPTVTNQGFTIIYDIDPNTVASISDNTVSILDLGTIDFMAYTEDNNANYEDYTEVFTITVTEAPEVYDGTGTFLKITSVDDLTDGYYVITNEADAFAMNNTHTTFFAHTAITPFSGTLTNPDASIVWKIETNGSGKTIYNEVIEKYVGWQSGNSASAEDAPADSNRWTFTYADSKFTVNNVATTTRQLSYNFTSPRFAAYGNTNQQELQLYKLTTSVIWTTDNQWSGTPSISEDVIIEGDLTVTDLNSFSAKTLTVNGSLTIEADGLVTVAENITNNGTFVVESEANLIQLTANTSDNSGEITVHRNSSLIKHLDYTLWSSPVAGQGLQAFSPQTLWYRIYTYNTTDNEWEKVFENQEDDDVDFEEGTGYMFRAPNDFVTTPYIYDGTFTGIPQSGNITVTFNTPGVYQGVGNPYPSNIKIEGADGFWDNNSDTGTLYFWTNVNEWNGEDYGGNNWATFSKVGGIGVIGDGESAENDDDEKIPNGIVPAGQGFVIETDGEITDVTFTNNMRTSNEGVFFKTANAEKSRLWLNLSQNGTNFNQMLIGYMEGTTQGYDFGFDAKMFNYTGDALYSLIDNNTGNYIIQGRALPFDDNDEVPLGFRALSGGTFTISLTNFDGLFTEGQDIFLKDNLTQTEQNLKTGNYTFVSEEGTFDNRFKIVYKESADLSVTTPDLNNNWLVYAKDGNFQIETQGFEMKEVVIYDMLGRTVYQKQANGTSHTTSAFKTNGVLIIKVITTDNQVLTKKTAI